MNATEPYTLPEEHSRTARVIGITGVRRLEDAHVAVFGIGGVGGHCVEALARAGVGRLTIIDGDVVTLSNINRQAVALHSTVGRTKVEVMAERIRDINPACEVTPLRLFYAPGTDACESVNIKTFDYVADCVDSMPAKVLLARTCHDNGVPIIAAMGAGNKCHPERFQIADLFKTNTDPLAKIMRRELKQSGITHLKVVYSDELPIPVHEEVRELSATENLCRPSPGSLSFVPSVMGLLMAGEIIRDLVKSES